MRIAKRLVLLLALGGSGACSGWIGDVNDAGTRDAGADGGDETTSTPEAVVSGNALDQASLFVCDGTPGSSPARLRLMDRVEWRRNTGSTSSDVSNNPFDANADHRYATYTADEEMNLTTLDIFLAVVESAADGWNQTNRYVINCIATYMLEPQAACIRGSTPDATCVEWFSAYLLERGILYRPPSEGEVSRLAAFATRMIAGEATSGTSRSESMEAIIAAAWLMPGALHHSELGEGEPDADGRRRLGPWELADVLAYALGRRAAGSPSINSKNPAENTNLYSGSGTVDGYLPLIVQAARDGSIYDAAVIRDIVATYYAGVDPRRDDLLGGGGYNFYTAGYSVRGEYWMAPGLESFFEQWLGYATLPTITEKTEPAATTSFTSSRVPIAYQNQIIRYAGRESVLTEQMTDAIARVVQADTDVFRSLMTTRTFVLPGIESYYGSTIEARTTTMAYVYNVTDIVPHETAKRWYELPANERGGILTHPAWLGAHALSVENDPNPVHRGKWVRENMLCQDVPDLPINVEAQFAEETRGESTRARMQEHIESKSECVGCHQYMNSLGYPFEIYNHAGFVRTDDHGAAPDGSSVLENMPDPELDGPVADAIELSRKLGDSPYVKRCFLRQLFRYFMGREETAADACVLTAMEQAYDASNGSLSETMIALFTSDAFQYRTEVQ